ncbi:hypothetical protein NC652_028335 [Populus alba x Populus x berolinensis]|nr:hypothetical protein NC652_028335 [Populus alba x Populus x berolinensis]
MADVVVDAMIAEAVRSESPYLGCQWQWVEFGALLSCGLVGENSAASKVSHESAIQATPIPVNGNGNILDEDNILLKKSSASATRRKRSQKNSNKRASMRTKSLIPEKGDSLISHQTNGLVFPSTEYCSKPLNSHVLLPDRGLELGCNPFWGLHVFVGWLGLMLGTFTYNRYLKTMKLRKILLWAHVGLSLLTLLDVILVSRLNLAYGVSDKIMVVFGSALFDAVNQFKYVHAIPCIIWTVMSPGIEGTLFALFMSINNLGSTLGSFVGAGLASILNLSSGSFDNLGLGIAIQVLWNAAEEGVFGSQVKRHYMLFTKPPYAKKPDIRWRLYVFKGGEALNGHFCDFLFLKRSSMKP